MTGTIEDIIDSFVGQTIEDIVIENDRAVTVYLGDDAMMMIGLEGGRMFIKRYEIEHGVLH